MGCSSSNPSVVAPPKSVRVGHGIQGASQTISEEELKRMLMDKQLELSSRARPLLECAVSAKEDAVFDEEDVPESSRKGRKQQALFRIAKEQSGGAWMVRRRSDSLTARAHCVFVGDSGLACVAVQ